MTRKKVLLALLALTLIVNALFLARIPMKPELWFISVIAIILFASPVIVMAVKWLGLKRGGALVLGLGIYALVFETIAIKTGLPYGVFQYGELLGPKLFDAVPATVLLAWTPLILGIMSLTQRISGFWEQVVIGTVSMMLVDMVLDPAAVHIGFWEWDIPGIYYGVPLVNFAGWLLSGGIAIAGVQVLKQRFKWPPLSKIFAINLFFILLFWTAVNVWAAHFIPSLLGIVLSAVIYRQIIVTRRV